MCVHRGRERDENTETTVHQELSDSSHTACWVPEWSGLKDSRAMRIPNEMKHFSDLPGKSLNSNLSRIVMIKGRSWRVTALLQGHGFLQV